MLLWIVLATKIISSLTRALVTETIVTKCAFGFGWCVCICVFLFFFSRFLGQILLLWLLFMHYSWTVTTKFDLSNNFQLISAHRTLLMDPQISLFSNFFFKNRSHSTIHTFKNYFATMFFNFQFQFSVFSCIQTDPKNNDTKQVFHYRVLAMKTKFDTKSIL